MQFSAGQKWKSRADVFACSIHWTNTNGCDVVGACDVCAQVYTQNCNNQPRVGDARIRSRFLNAAGYVLYAWEDLRYYLLCAKSTRVGIVYIIPIWGREGTGRIVFAAFRIYSFIIERRTGNELTFRVFRKKYFSSGRTRGMCV